MLRSGLCSIRTYVVRVNVVRVSVGVSRIQIRNIFLQMAGGSPPYFWCI